MTLRASHQQLLSGNNKQVKKLKNIVRTMFFSFFYLTELKLDLIIKLFILHN